MDKGVDVSDEQFKLYEEVKNDPGLFYNLCVRFELLLEENQKLISDAITSQCEWEELFKKKDDENKLMRQYLEDISAEAEYQDYKERKTSPCCNRMGHAREVLEKINE